MERSLNNAQALYQPIRTVSRLPVPPGQPGGTLLLFQPLFRFILFTLRSTFLSKISDDEPCVLQRTCLSLTDGFR